MPNIPIILSPSPDDPHGTAGVDSSVHPRRLGTRKLHRATNLAFEEGVLRTRPGFRYHHLGTHGQFQGSTTYRPGEGTSARRFASPYKAALALIAGGKTFVSDTSSGRPKIVQPICGTPDYCRRGWVFLFQAENYLIAQNPLSLTTYWEGQGCLIESPGMADCLGENATEVPKASAPATACDETSTSLGKEDLLVGGGEAFLAEGSSHDSFCASAHQNWLANAASFGVFVHGRIHQYVNHAVFVSDMIHKRGWGKTDDILKMEEQALPSYGDPLTVNSRLGNLVAWATLPNKGTPNGEGDLIAYFENGIVAFDTFKFPRETRVDGSGEVLQEGWEAQRLVDHRAELVSAVGPNAVAVMPTDHFLRSSFGLHFLKSVQGEGSFAPEHLTRISQDLEAWLKQDQDEHLYGCATGFWAKGHRLFATTGLGENRDLSALPSARGFVSINQATTFSEDRTPRAVAEGLWAPDHEIKGIHQFAEVGPSRGPQTYGFLASDEDAELWFAEIVKENRNDYRCSKEVPIEWEAVTGQTVLSRNSQAILKGGFLEGVFANSETEIKVFMRSNLCPGWHLWKHIQPLDRLLELGEQFHRTYSLGTVSPNRQEAAWFQFRILGRGYVELENLMVTLDEGDEKTGRDRSAAVASDRPNLFELNTEPPTNRWR